MNFNSAIHWYRISNSERNDILHSFEPLLVIDVTSTCFKLTLLTTNPITQTIKFSPVEQNLSIHQKNKIAYSFATESLDLPSETILIFT